jgi:hypothetical protein
MNNLLLSRLLRDACYCENTGSSWCRQYWLASFWSFKQYESKVAISSEASGWEIIEEHVDVPLQSALTASVVRDLAKSGTCGLPKLSELRLAHEAMLKAFFDRIERATGHRPEYCNIT